MSGGFLQRMAESSRARSEAARRACSLAQMRERAREAAAPPPLRLSAAGFDLIAEVKLRSPAVGQLKSGAEDLQARVADYATAGAAAVSVLTEPDRFDGALEHLEIAARALAGAGVPAMRKDFLVDPYQVCEARLAGAGGVLVILRMLPRTQLEELIEEARSLGLFVLLEAFDDRDLELASELVARFSKQLTLLVGVNSRDLVTLQVVPGRLAQLASRLPTGVPRVAESGVASAEDAARVAASGYDLALVGSALMTAADSGALVRDMLAAGRTAKGG